MVSWSVSGFASRFSSSNVNLKHGFSVSSLSQTRSPTKSIAPAPTSDTTLAHCRGVPERSGSLSTFFLPKTGASLTLGVSQTQCRFCRSKGMPEGSKVGCLPSPNLTHCSHSSFPRKGTRWQGCAALLSVLEKRSKALQERLQSLSAAWGKVARTREGGGGACL